MPDLCDRLRRCAAVLVRSYSAAILDQSREEAALHGAVT
jgi:hypothetical protein